MDTNDEKIDTTAAFIEALEALGDAGLARLRRATSNWNPDLLSIVAPYLPDSEGWRRDADLTRFSVVAVLYGWHGQSGGGKGTVGTALAALAKKSKAEASIAERLMHQIVWAERVEDLREPLIRTVQALKRAGIPLDWTRLAKDLAEWEGFFKRPQKQWAKDFWSALTKKAGGQQ